MTDWTDQRDEWMKTLTPADVERIAAEVTRWGEADETEGDRAETRDALHWLRSRGEGREWGIVGAVAANLRLFPTEGGENADHER